MTHKDSSAYKVPTFSVGEAVSLKYPAEWDDIPLGAKGEIIRVWDESRIEVEWEEDFGKDRKSTVMWAWRVEKQQTNIHTLYNPQKGDRVVLKYPNTSRKAGSCGEVTEITANSLVLVRWDGDSYAVTCHKWRLVKETSPRAEVDPALQLFNNVASPKLAEHPLSSVKYRACRRALLARCQWARKHPKETAVIYYCNLSAAEYLRYCQAAMIKLRVQYKTRRIIGTTFLATKDYTTAATRRRKRWADKKLAKALKESK